MCFHPQHRARHRTKIDALDELSSCLILGQGVLP
jgi:hypothetical protein